ncbi:hypothetical protein AKJ44_00960 [candidate division MSBL1 archaeon SCGC-AAA261F17]|uniref:Uncharacterized protein n=1 Tax=candidate division MSBL1 archaeon SCGC-AAA261F17 TaxID=1698274 RepID=A0A133V785_9EURY|nr:hypothetical protein AKJ44_00960 [candidate division MSBL1 archaeon SCGC-AAA261F17]
MSPKKILTITIIAIIAVGLLWITKPWQKIGGEEGGETGENQQLTENQQEGGGIDVPPGYTLFKYQASFQYLSSSDNAPIANDLFMVFPCPNIDNKPVIPIGPDTDAENTGWQLIAHYIENNENV